MEDNDKIKRLVIVLLVLVIVFVAGFWLSDYNSKQPSHANANNSDSIAVEEEQLYTGGFDSLTLIQDKNDRYEERNPQEEGVSTTLEVNNSVDLMWPESLKGVKEIKPLQCYINKMLFQNNTTDIHKCVSDFLEYNPEYVGAYFTESISLRVDCEQEKYIQFEANISTDRGGETSSSISNYSEYIIFDKYQQRVLSLNDIILRSKQKVIVNMLNKILIKRYGKDDFGFFKVTKIPPSIKIEDAQLLFTFAKGEVEAVCEGNISMGISFEKLSPYLTDKFKRLVKD